MSKILITKMKVEKGSIEISEAKIMSIRTETRRDPFQSTNRLRLRLKVQ